MRILSQQWKIRVCFAVLAFLGFIAPAEAQLWLREDTATTIDIHLVKTADGTGETAATVANISLSLISHSDTSSSSSVSVTLAATGTANDCVHVAKGDYNVEITAAQVPTAGRLKACYSYTGTYTLCDNYIVLPQVTYDLWVAGGWSSNSDIWNTATASVTAGIGLQVKSNLDERVSDAGGMVHRGTAQAGAATTITLDTGASATDNYYRWKRIVIRSGTGMGQTAIITAYTGLTKVATISCEGTTSGAWMTNPNSTSVFVIQPRNR